MALVLSSLVDYRQETAWADRARDMGARVGFVGIAASKMPQLFAPHSDFIVMGEPEAAVERLADGEVLEGPCPSPAIQDLDSLPFPRRDLIGARSPWWSLERAIGPHTRAAVVTHLYGLPCDMEEILRLSRPRPAHRRGLRPRAGRDLRRLARGHVRGCRAFSFQVLKPLNTCGGGIAYAQDRGLSARIASLAQAEPWPSPRSVERRLKLARLERALMRPLVFTATLFPVLWSAARLGSRPDVYLWEKVRPLVPFPKAYGERYSNVQAALGRAGLEQLDEWTAATRRNAAFLTDTLSSLPGVTTPPGHVIGSTCVAGGIVGMVSWIGPAAFARLGVHAWWASLVPAAVVLGVSWWISRKTRSRLPAVAPEHRRTTTGRAAWGS